jgi:hypothetical protein
VAITRRGLDLQRGQLRRDAERLPHAFDQVAAAGAQRVEVERLAAVASFERLGDQRRQFVVGVVHDGSCGVMPAWRRRTTSRACAV